MIFLGSMRLPLLVFNNLLNRLRVDIMLKQVAHVELCVVIDVELELLSGLIVLSVEVGEDGVDVVKHLNNNSQS